MELKYYLRGLGLGIAITAIVMGIASSKNKTMTNEEIIARAKQLGMTENTVLDEINHKDGKQDADKADDSAKTDADKTGSSAKTDVSGKADGSAQADADKTGASAQADNSKSGSANLPANNDNSNTSQKTGSTDNVAKTSASGENEASDASDKNSQSGARKTDSGVDAEAGDTESKTDGTNKKPEGGSQSQDTNTKTDSPDSNTKTGSPDANTNAGSQNNNTKTGSSEPKPSGTDAAASAKPMVITVGSGDGSYSVSKKLADVGAIESADEFDDFLCNNGYDKKIRTGTYTIPANASEEQMARIITGAE